MSVYYNDNEPFVVEWLKNLITAGHLPAGDVDDRPIQEVQPDDVRGYTQCHFFAGIGGWALALRLAGWPDDRPVWTGSCPCQPFSAAGRRGGHADARHLWPVWYPFIAECRPPAVFGEQVASKAGRSWLAAVRVDLEGMGYAVGAADLPAASVGAPHKRSRLWFVGHASGTGLAQQRGERRTPRGPASADAGQTAIGAGTPTRGVADTERNPRNTRWVTGEPREGDGAASTGPHAEPGRCGNASPWADPFWLPCRDGKARPTEARSTEPALLRLVNGLRAGLGYLRDGSQTYLSPLIQDTPHRVGRLRGYGNAIVPQVAAAFIQAYLDTVGTG